MTVPHVCVVHPEHVPAPLVLHDHHIQPRGMGGPSTHDNMVKICPTGHYNVHTYLAAIVFAHAVKPLATPAEMELATRGFERWVAAGKPGDARAAYG